MKYKGIVFDLDGVICSTDRFHYLAWKHIADGLGVHFDEQVNHRLRGVSRMESLDIVLEPYPGTLSDAEKQQLAEDKNSIYRESLAGMSPNDLTAEVSATLLALRAAGLKLAIGSSSKNARYILERLGLQDFFDAVSDGTNIRLSKPHPEVFLMAADFIGLQPSECLVVEDAAAGVEAAIRAGMDSAAVGDAVHCGKATYNLARFSELLTVVGVY